MRRLTYFAFLALGLNSCVTLKRCERKFSQTLTDTVRVEKQVTLSIPKDSAIVRIITDTSTVIREIRQGRATVRIVREPTYTTVYAKCDSATIAQKILLKAPKNNIIMGVSKWYRLGFWISLGLLVVFTLAFFISRLFTITIQKK